MTEARLDQVYRPSEDIVVREIEGELIIVPLTDNIGDLEEDLYTFNATGRAIWDRLDGAQSLRAVASDLADDYEAPVGDIERDALGLLSELLARGLAVEA